MPGDSPVTPEQIRDLIDGQLIELEPAFGPDDDLFQAGLDSMAIMQLLLMIEETFGPVIPMGEVTRENFHSTSAIARLVNGKLTSP